MSPIFADQPLVLPPPQTAFYSCAGLGSADGSRPDLSRLCQSIVDFPRFEPSVSVPTVQATLQWLTRHSLPVLPHAFPGPDGTIMLEWANRPEEIYVEFASIGLKRYLVYRAADGSSMEAGPLDIAPLTAALRGL